MISKLRNLFIKTIKFPILILRILICKTRSYFFSQLIDSGDGKITITDPFLSIKIQKSKGSKLIISGNFRVTSHIGGVAAVRIILGQDSILKVDGDFVIGHGVRIFLNNNSYLFIGGKKNESDSGITADTLIMVNRKIMIGKDFICAWNVFISDSDWHQIGDQPHQSDVIIGDHVWIANSCSILKGSLIGNNSIVASHSKVINNKYPHDSLLAGIPAKVAKSEITWSRDINPNAK
jgi:acetyltransferase-like isoleucine patch superfamily enzyme